MYLTNGRAEFAAATRDAVGDEDGGDCASRLCMLLESLQRARGVGMRLDVVVLAEPLSQLLREQTTNPGVVVDDGEDGPAGRAAILQAAGGSDHHSRRVSVSRATCSGTPDRFRTTS